MEQRKPHTLLAGMRIGAAIWRFLKKLKLELPYDPAIPLLDIYPKVGKHSFEKIRVPLGLSQPYLQ